MIDFLDGKIKLSDFNFLIIPRPPQSTQYIRGLNRRVQEVQKFNNLISDRRLTESLELPEQCGLWDEAGLHLIKVTQCEGVQ